MILIVLTLFLIHSCTSEDQELAEKAEIEKSEEFIDFVIDSHLLAEKFVSYTRTLSDDEFEKLVYNQNDDEYMAKIIDKADIKNELQKLAKSRNQLCSNTNILRVSTSEQQKLLYNHSTNLPKVVIKTRSEDAIAECERRKSEDYSWAQTTYNIAIIGCTCMIEVPIAACICYVAALTNYANDIRLADRSYDDCVKGVRK